MLPSRIKIGAIVWTVEEVEPAVMDVDRQTPGDQSEMTQTIRIAKNLTPEMKAQVFIHELLHCIDSELDHDLVDLLASALHQVLVENNGLVAILSQKPAAPAERL